MMACDVGTGNLLRVSMVFPLSMLETFHMPKGPHFVTFWFLDTKLVHMLVTFISRVPTSYVSAQVLGLTGLKLHSSVTPDAYFIFVDMLVFRRLVNWSLS